MESDRTSSLYKATITSFHYAYLLLPVWLTSEKESLKFFFNTLAERERQTGFNFNDCRFQVEHKDSPGSTLYKITIRSCRCEHGFQASVGKITWGNSPVIALVLLSCRHARWNDAGRPHCLYGYKQNSPHSGRSTSEVAGVRNPHSGKWFQNRCDWRIRLQIHSDIIYITFSAVKYYNLSIV